MASRSVVCTVRGRVVYDRKVHGMTRCDVLRIYRTSEPAHTQKQDLCELELLAETLMAYTAEGDEDFAMREQLFQVVLRRVREFRAAMGESDEFGGGEFGGAGATRPFNPFSNPFPTDEEE